MSDLVRLMVVLRRIPPEAWDAIIPHGPRYRVAVGLASRVSQVELNPQPIPPGHQLLLASAAVAQDLANAAIAAEAAGTENSSRIVSRAVDDWCGTPHGHLPIPWPGPWPFPWPPEDGDQRDWDVQASRVVGALSLASVASRLSDGEIRETLSRGADQLLDAGLSG